MSTVTLHIHVCIIYRYRCLLHPPTPPTQPLSSTGHKGQWNLSNSKAGFRYIVITVSSTGYNLAIEQKFVVVYEVPHYSHCNIQNRQRGGAAVTTEEQESSVCNQAPGCPPFTLLGFRDAFHGRTMGKGLLCNAASLIILTNGREKHDTVYKYYVQLNLYIEHVETTLGTNTMWS